MQSRIVVPAVGSVYQNDKLVNSWIVTGSEFQTYRTDTIKREKPRDLFENGTPLWHWRSEMRDELWTYTYVPETSLFPISVTTDSTKSAIGLGRGNITDNLRSLSDEVDNKLLSKLRADSANLANMLGEYRQSADLFSSSVKGIIRVGTAIIKKDPRILLYEDYLQNGRRKRGFPRRQLRRLADLHLQFMYGVKPLMNDMTQVMEALKSRSNRPIIIKASASSSLSDKRITFHPFPLDRKIDCECVETGTVHYGGVARATISNDLLFESFGKFGFTNPAGVIWELTPWSFVIDWWLSIGQFLGSLDNSLYFQNVKVIRTMKVVENVKNSVLGVNGYYKYESYQRDPPRTLSTVAHINYKPSISLTHIANGTALLTQFLSKVR